MKQTKIVGFYVGPSGGKSTLALQLAGWMKAKRLSVEYVSEFAKDLTWDGSLQALTDQVYVFGEQFHRNYRLYGQVDWIITDSPTIIQLYYIENSLPKLESPEDGAFRYYFKKLIHHSHFVMPHVLFRTDRGDRTFIQEGRNQNEEESRKIDEELDEIMSRHGIPVADKVSTLDQVLKRLELA